jgi:hypothetical protein
MASPINGGLNGKIVYNLSTIEIGDFSVAMFDYTGLYIFDRICWDTPTFHLVGGFNPSETYESQLG